MDVEPVQADLLDVELLDAGLPAPTRGGFTTRAGGCSPPPWRGLNLGTHVGDEAARVAAARARLARTLGLEPADVVSADQVHGTRVAVVEGRVDGPVAAADALVTTVPGLALLVLAADCLPVLLADPEAGVVAVAHAGRQGLVDGVLQQTLAVMTSLGATPAGIVAVLGPAVCGRCYELPADLAEEVGRAVPGTRGTTRSGAPSADLAAGAEALLRGGGVVSVRRVGGCTLEQPGRFFSYRRDGRTGRHAGVVRLLERP